MLDQVGTLAGLLAPLLPQLVEAKGGHQLQKQAEKFPGVQPVQSWNAVIYVCWFDGGVSAH